MEIGDATKPFLTVTPVLASVMPVVDRNVTIRHLDTRPTLAEPPDGFVF